jgi:hypothetical protein
MREGYTLVWVGWQFDAHRLRVEAPAANVTRPVKVTTIQNERARCDVADLPPATRRSTRMNQQQR